MRPYDVEADWNLLNSCNYRCDYCFMTPELLGEKIVQFASPAGWAAAFDATGLTWLLHLTGGEPSVYPKFIEFCETLTARHYISFNSNLTHTVWLEFAARINPARVSFIHAGVHSVERLKRQGIAPFKRHLAALMQAGFAVYASVVATPSVLADPDASQTWLDDTGIVVFPKLLRGAYRGGSYPQSYTADERAAFAAMAAKARAANAPRMAGWPELPSIDLSTDDEMLLGEDRFTGQSCAAGQKFISLKENGEAFRCSTKQHLGNILNGTLRLKAAAARCDTRYCPYWCRKYTRIVPDTERKSVWSDVNWWREQASERLMAWCG